MTRGLVNVAVTFGAVVASCVPGNEAGRDMPDVSATDCGSDATESRWAVSADRLARLAEYGGSAGEELADVWGVATLPDGHVLIYDAGNTHVIKLRNDFTVEALIGRDGQGPGEFVYQRTVHGDWIAAGDSSFLVLGLGVGIVSEFGFDGTFLRYPTRTPPFPVPILRIGVVAGRLVYAVDVIDRSSGERVLQTWRLEPEGPNALLRTDTMPTLPRWRGRLVRGQFADQADPLWAVGKSLRLRVRR